ncbi:MAG: NAD-dependent epimerase/dehydratase family protein [Myxococcota bacterium]
MTTTTTSKPRVFVTGATGFLGRHLLDRLAEGDVEVVAMTRQPPLDVDPRVTWTTGNVNDAESVARAAEGCEVAYHLAGKVSRDPADAEEMYRVHVEGTDAVLTALARVGCRRVVVASTSGTVAVSEDPEVVADEGAEAPMHLIARWPYYRSKFFAERVARERNRDGFEVVIVNPSLLLGPGDERGSSTEDVRNFMQRKVPFVPGGGMAFCDARDAATALMLAMDKGKAGEKYLVNGANMSLTDFFGRLARITGVDAPRVTLPRTSTTVAGAGAELMERFTKALRMPALVDKTSAELANVYWYCDASKAERELGWQHRDPGHTLADTVDDLRARGVVWPGDMTRASF